MAALCIPFALLSGSVDGAAVLLLIVVVGVNCVLAAESDKKDEINKKDEPKNKNVNPNKLSITSSNLQFKRCPKCHTALRKKIKKCPQCGHEMGGPIKTESKSNKRKRIFHKKRTADDAWKTCPECGRRVYHAVKECPHCSYKF